MSLGGNNRQSISGYTICGCRSREVKLQTTITDVATIFNGTQKGSSKLYDFSSDSNMTLQINAGDYVKDNVIVGVVTCPEFKFIQGDGFRLRGTSNISGEFILKGVNQPFYIHFRSDTEAIIFGALEGGSQGAVSILSYSVGLVENSVSQDIQVVGANFNPDMEISFSLAATLNSWTYIDSENITINVTTNGNSGDELNITYDNGVLFTDINAITIGGASNFLYSSNPFGSFYAFHQTRDTQTYGITLRRSSDDAETDVGFNSAFKCRLDSPVSSGGDLSTWIGSDDAYITKYWNAGSLGNDFDLVQSDPLKQHKFISSGALIINDGWVTASTDGRVCQYKTSVQRDWDDGFFTIFTGTRKNDVGTQEIAGFTNGVNLACRLYHFGDGFRFIVAGTTSTTLNVSTGINIDTNYMFSCVRTLTNQEVFVNGVSAGSETPPTDTKSIPMNIHASAYNTVSNPLNGFFSYFGYYQLEAPITEIEAKITPMLTE